MRSRTHPVRILCLPFLVILISAHYLELGFLPDVVNDFDVDFTADPKLAEAYTRDQRNRRKIKEHTEQLNLNIISPLREGKRLLVLDIDYSACLNAQFMV